MRRLTFLFALPMIPSAKLKVPVRLVIRCALPTERLEEASLVMFQTSLETAHNNKILYVMANFLKYLVYLQTCILNLFLIGAMSDHQSQERRGCKRQLTTLQPEFCLPLKILQFLPFMSKCI